MPTLGARNRDLVRLWVDDAPQFYGPVTESPHPRDPSFGDLNVVGAAELLARRVIGPEVYLNQDIALIVRDLVQRYRHPALVYNETYVPMTGKVLSRFSAPWRTLQQALDTLGKCIDGDVGVPFGVLPDGTFFFGFQLAPDTPVPYSSVQGLQWLRVSGDEVVSRSYLIALNKQSGTGYRDSFIYPVGYDFGSQGNNIVTSAGGGLPYKPGTYVLMAEDPDWLDLGAQTASLVPDGADVLTTPGSYANAAGVTLAVNNYSNAEAARDPDPATWAQNTEGTFTSYQYQHDVDADVNPFVGFRLLYGFDDERLPPGGYVREVTLQYSYLTEGPGRDGQPALVQGSATFNFNLPGTGSNRKELVVLLPLPAEIAQAVLAAPLTATSRTTYRAAMNVDVSSVSDPRTTIPAGTLKLYRWEPIGLDRVKADTLARKLLLPPAQEPTEFTLPYLLAPVPGIVLTGAPGGDLAGDVAELSYRHDAQGLRSTTVKLEQPGVSTTSRVIRLAAKGRAHDAQTQLRGFLEAQA